MFKTIPQYSGEVKFMQRIGLWGNLFDQSKHHYFALREILHYAEDDNDYFSEFLLCTPVTFLIIPCARLNHRISGQ